MNPSAYYRNPFRDVRDLTPFRIDMGVDYGGEGPVYALGRGKVVRLDEHASWPGEHYIAIRLLSGPAKGFVYYLAENIRFPDGLKLGDEVTRRTRIARLLPDYPHCEIGWCSDSPNYPPIAYGCYNEGDLTFAGMNFSALLNRLRCSPGETLGRDPKCPLPSWWPRW